MGLHQTRRRVLAVQRGAGKVRRRRRCLFLCATMPEAGKDGASTRDVADEGSRFDPVNNCSKSGSRVGGW